IHSGGGIYRTSPRGPARCPGRPRRRRRTRRRVVRGTGRGDATSPGGKAPVDAESGPESAAPADRPFVRPLSSDGPGGSGGEGPPGERGGSRLRPRRRGRAGARGGTRELRDAGAGGPVLLEGRATPTPGLRTVAASRAATTRIPLPGQFRQHVGRERGLGQGLGAGARPHGPATRAVRRDRALRRCGGSPAGRVARSPRQGTDTARESARCRVLFSRRWDGLPETPLPRARHDPGGTRGIRQGTSFRFSRRSCVVG